MDKCAADRLDRKIRLIVLVVGLLTVASASALMAVLEFPADVPLDNSRPAGDDADTLASLERGLAEVFETQRRSWRAKLRSFAACPMPGQAPTHRGSPLNARQTY